jgi:hypothetical protein
VNTGTLEYKYADDCEIFNTYEVCAKNTIELKKKDAEEQKNKIMISCFDYYTKTIREEKKKLIKIEHEINAISLRETI